MKGHTTALISKWWKQFGLKFYAIVYKKTQRDVLHNKCHKMSEDSNVVGYDDMNLYRRFDTAFCPHLQGS
jgi:hypothetical protein